MNLIRRTEGQEPALLSRLDPFRTFRDLLRWDPFAEMEPLFGKTDLGVTPNFEVKETKEAVEFKADLPGIKDKDVEIAVSGNRLSISGKREEEEKKQEDRYYAYERWYGSFHRTFTLPESCDPENVKAELKDGVLWISVPKKAEAQPRRVELGGAGQRQERTEEKAQEKVESKGAAKAD